MNDGNVQVAPDPLAGGAAVTFYAGQIGESMGGPEVAEVQAADDVELTPDVPVSGSATFDALVMSWRNTNTNDPTILNVAAWEYVYDIDPDLTGTLITFSLLAPAGVWDFSLELIDVNGNSRGWFGVPPNTSWGVFSIDPSSAVAQVPFSVVITSGVFDITHVTTIRLNESSQGGIAFIDNPAQEGDSTTPWNAWNSLSVRRIFDIKPDSEPSCFNSDGNGLIPVRIMGTPTFDVNTIDAETLQLDAQPVATGGGGKLMCHVEDVNGDGLDDLVCQFDDNGVYDPTDTVGTVTGLRTDASPFVSTDAICIVQ